MSIAKVKIEVEGGVADYTYRCPVCDSLLGDSADEIIRRQVVCCHHIIDIPDVELIDYDNRNEEPPCEHAHQYLGVCTECWVKV